MIDLNFLQAKHDVDTKINYNLINQIERINNYLENKNDEYTLKLLEKQFLNTEFFKDWLNSYSYNKLQIINEECDELFGSELETIKSYCYFLDILI
jgi:bacterioferritin (cytochrome b1)